MSRKRAVPSALQARTYLVDTQKRLTADPMNISQTVSRAAFTALSLVSVPKVVAVDAFVTLI